MFCHTFLTNRALRAAQILLLSAFMSSEPSQDRIVVRLEITRAAHAQLRGLAEYYGSYKGTLSRLVEWLASHDGPTQRAIISGLVKMPPVRIEGQPTSPDAEAKAAAAAQARALGEQIADEAIAEVAQRPARRRRAGDAA